MSLSSISHVKRTEDKKRPAPPPMATFNKIIVDRSGSMYSMNGVQVTMNEKLLEDAHDTAKESNTPTFVTFTTFDDKVETHISNKNILTTQIPDKSELKKYLEPRGSTRFIDTILEAITDIKKEVKDYIATLPKKTRDLNPRIVKLINCTTDGYDNMSNHTANELQTAMNNFRNNGGEALLLTANMDAQEIGEQYGFNSDTSLTVHASDPDAIEYAFQCLRTTSAQVSSGGTAIPYTQLQRATSSQPTVEIDHFQSLAPPSLPLRVQGLPLLRQNAVILPESAFSDDEDDFIPLPSTPRPMRRSARLLARMNAKK